MASKYMPTSRGKKEGCIALWKTGQFKYAEIARMHDISVQSVTNWCKGVQQITMNEVDKVVGEVMGTEFSAKDQSAVAIAAKRKIVFAGMCEDILKINLDILNNRIRDPQFVENMTIRDQKIINEVLTSSMDSVSTGSLHDAMMSVGGFEGIDNMAPVISFESVDSIIDSGSDSK